MFISELSFIARQVANLHISYPLILILCTSAARSFLILTIFFWAPSSQMSSQSQLFPWGQQMINLFSFVCLSVLSSTNVWQLGSAHKGNQRTHISDNWRDRRVFASSQLDIALLFRLFFKFFNRLQREHTMSGKERSPRHRPWSVYRANTFDLSAEMMGLALSGN